MFCILTCSSSVRNGGLLVSFRYHGLADGNELMRDHQQQQMLLHRLKVLDLG